MYTAKTLYFFCSNYIWLISIAPTKETDKGITTADSRIGLHDGVKLNAHMPDFQAGSCKILTTKSKTAHPLMNKHILKVKSDMFDNRSVYTCSKG